MTGLEVTQKCREVVNTGTRSKARGCKRDAVSDGYCLRHHPEYVSPRDWTALPPDIQSELAAKGYGPGRLRQTSAARPEGFYWVWSRGKGWEPAHYTEHGWFLFGSGSAGRHSDKAVQQFGGLIGAAIDSPADPEELKPPTRRATPSCCPICKCLGLGKAKTVEMDGEKFAVRACRYCGFEEEPPL